MLASNAANHGPISPAHLSERLRWRYSCRNYDPERIISPEVWEKLEETLILTPSSYGLQPWRFLVVTDKEYRKMLYPLSNNQQPVLDASHLIIFAVLERISAEDIEQWCRRRLELRQGAMSQAAFEGMRRALSNELLRGSRQNTLYEWASEQAHIALGSFIASCALLGIDSSPMGGVKTHEIDEFLNLKAKRLRSVVLCAAGYRAAEERGTGGKKERFAREELITYLGYGTC